MNYDFACDQDVRCTSSITSSSLSSAPAVVKASFLEAWPGAKDGWGDVFSPSFSFHTYVILAEQDINL